MTFSPVFPDWQHQTRAKKLAYHRDYFAWLMEMGTGKTKVCIDEFQELYYEGKIEFVFIMAPKGVYMNWINNELPAHLTQQAKDDSFTRVWMSGGGNKTEQEYLSHLLGDHAIYLKIFVMNTEAISSGDKAMKFARALLKKYEGRSYFALDESTYAKNPDSKRSENAAELANMATYRRIMTGYPVPRAPLDMYGQAEVLKKGLLGQSWYAFRARYARLREMELKGRIQANGKPQKIVVVDGYKNIDDLQDRIKEWSYRVLKEECLDLPPKIYTRRDVELTEDQQRHYADLKQFSIAELQPGVVSTNMVITKLLRLQQLICGHIKDDDGVLRSVKNNRVDALMDVLGEASGKVIIWSRFRHDIDVIVDRIRAEHGQFSVAQFHGGNTKTRDQEAWSFINEDECRFMVSSYAGGHGNTWIVADTVVYFSNEFDLEKRMQSEDRAHRGGQTKHVTYVDLVSPGTIDEKILEALRDKIDVASTVTGDKYKEWVL